MGRVSWRQVQLGCLCPMQARRSQAVRLRLLDPRHLCAMSVCYLRDESAPLHACVLNLSTAHHARQRGGPHARFLVGSLHVQDCRIMVIYR